MRPIKSITEFPGMRVSTIIISFVFEISTNIEVHTIPDYFVPLYPIDCFLYTSYFLKRVNSFLKILS